MQNQNLAKMHFSKLGTDATSVHYYMKWKTRLD